jgi:hypothetical protein
VKEWERLNEDINQSPMDSMNLCFSQESNDVSPSSNDQSQIYFDNLSPSSFKSQAGDEPYISEDEQNMYVVCFKSSCLSSKILYRPCMCLFLS